MHRLGKGWLELESDPGLFTLLVEDFGVRGAQVEEIYDLQKPIEGPVYGFIFLFKWIEERRVRRKITQEEESLVVDEEIINSIFFAQQVIPNSCATHALLSVLLNCDKIKLGDTLNKVKDFTHTMSPEAKGYAIGNMPDLARAHNNHARPEPYRLSEKQQGISTGRTMEAFHFVSYVPINGRLFELDGLKPYPIDHGPWGEHEDWTDHFRRVISERLGMAAGGMVSQEPYHDIRFSLMSVVPDRRQQYEHKLSTLKTNRQIVLEALQQMVKVTNPEITSESDRQRDLYGGGLKSCFPQPHSIIQTRQQKNAIANALASALSSSKEGNSSTSLTESAGSPSDQESHSYYDDDSAMLEGEEERMDSDPTKPLTVDTSMELQSPGPDSESTDTASEVEELLHSSPDSIGGHSPGMWSRSSLGENSPSKLEEKFSPEFMTDSGLLPPGGSMQDKLQAISQTMKGECGDNKADVKREGGSDQSSSSKGSKSRFASQQGFTPKDLLALLKNVEEEIKSCEQNLKDETEKRRKYKVDDCRRTHNYDQFVCTFLSMLAEQGHLARLVEQQMVKRRRQGGVNVSASSSSSVKKQDKRRKAKGKKRK